MVAIIASALLRSFVRRRVTGERIARVLGGDSESIQRGIEKWAPRAGFWILFALTLVILANRLQLEDIVQPTLQAVDSLLLPLSDTIGIKLSAAIILNFLRELVLLAVATFTLVITLRTLARVFPALEKRLHTWYDARPQTLRIQQLELVSSSTIAGVLGVVVRVARVILTILVAYVYLLLALSFFPETRTLATTLIEYILTPIGSVGEAILKYLPNAFFILVIVILVRYLLRFVHFLFDAIEARKITLANFHPEWAAPTYQIVRVLILAFAVVLIFPYLPGSGSEAFQGVSVFLGILVSLGSASVIGNAMAGIVLTYTRAFSVGDRVKIGDTVGDVLEKTLLVTRIKTIKNVEISVPNSVVMSNHILNFSAAAQKDGLILNTSVTIGYDVPWPQVHELLIGAALDTQDIVPDPKPFVFQTSLDDFYVSYELNATTFAPQVMARIYSDLHQHIQDRFAEAGVEIMSPHYGALRDGNLMAVPEDALPEGYQAPGFRIK